MRFRTLVTAGLAAAVAAYLFDPISGRGRRARLRDRSAAIARHSGIDAGPFSRRARNITQDRTRQLTDQAEVERAMDDASVADRVRSQVLGRNDVHATELLVNVEDGIVSLRGELGDRERVDRVIDLTTEVAGVRGVENLIHLPDTPAPTKAPVLGDTWNG
jgi:osmotically-inducible protein OsmY